MHVADADPVECNCFALRSAARHVTQVYDTALAPLGLRTTQYSLLARLGRLGPLRVNDLADALVLDRTTLAHNLKPLLRDRLVQQVPSPTDARSKLVRLTPAGRRALAGARERWAIAQRGFEAHLGAGKSAALRALLAEVVATDPLRTRVPSTHRG